MKLEIVVGHNRAPSAQLQVANMTKLTEQN